MSEYGKAWARHRPDLSDNQQRAEDAVSPKDLEHGREIAARYPLAHINRESLAHEIAYALEDARRPGERAAVALNERFNGLTAPSGGDGTGPDVRDVSALVRAERNAAHDLLRALRLAGHVPGGAWRRRVNSVVALESEGDIADAKARAMSIVWDVEQSDRIVGGSA